MGEVHCGQAVQMVPIGRLRIEGQQVAFKESQFVNQCTLTENMTDLRVFKDIAES